MVKMAKLSIFHFRANMANSAEIQAQKFRRKIANRKPRASVFCSKSKCWQKGFCFFDAKKNTIFSEIFFAEFSRFPAGIQLKIPKIRASDQNGPIWCSQPWIFRQLSLEVKPKSEKAAAHGRQTVKSHTACAKNCNIYTTCNQDVRLEATRYAAVQYVSWYPVSVASKPAFLLLVSAALLSSALLSSYARYLCAYLVGARTLLCMWFIYDKAHISGTRELLWSVNLIKISKPLICRSCQLSFWQMKIIVVLGFKTRKTWIFWKKLVAN